GNTESLFLTAGYVGAAPLDPRLIAARHPVDKFIGAGCLTCFHALLIGGVRVTPAQVIKNRSGKQRILLQYHGYLISQHLGIILADVHAAHTDASLIHIVKTADQIHKTALAGAGTADDADGFS